VESTAAFLADSPGIGMEMIVWLSAICGILLSYQLVRFIVAIKSSREHKPSDANVRQGEGASTVN